MRSSKEPWHVLQVDDAGSNSAKHVEGGGPHVPLVVCCLPLSGHAERLAGEASGHDVNQASMSSGVPVTDECADIAVDGGFVKVAVSDAGREDTLGVVVPLDVPDALVSE